jgi:hypothetical protein
MSASTPAPLDASTAAPLDDFDVDLSDAFTAGRGPRPRGMKRDHLAMLEDAEDSWEIHGKALATAKLRVGCPLSSEPPHARELLVTELETMVDDAHREMVRVISQDISGWLVTTLGERVAKIAVDAEDIHKKRAVAIVAFRAEKQAIVTKLIRLGSY